jgi:uncharacterized membrane protein YbaN (DUF454 family)
MMQQELEERGKMSTRGKISFIIIVLMSQSILEGEDKKRTITNISKHNAIHLFHLSFHFSLFTFHRQQTPDTRHP